MKKTKYLSAALSVALLLMCVLPVTAYAQSDEPTEDTTPPTTAAPVEEKPLTPDGQATVVDNVTDEDGKEFYTIVTPAENTFYLVIDKQKESQNVYFLNAVTERDLAALAEKDADTAATSEPTTTEPEKCTCKTKCEAGAVDTKCPVCKLNLTGCEGTAPEAADTGAETVEQETPQQGNTGAIVIVVLVVLAAGAAGYYFKVVKPKRDLDDADDFEDIQFEDEPEELPDDGRLPDPEDYGEAPSDEDGGELPDDGDKEDDV